MTSPTRIAPLCLEHGGQRSRDPSPRMKEMLDNLPENQSGPGRHKCAICAYNEGFEAGKKHALETERKSLETL